MALPTLDQYNEAVQHPKTAFSDSQLKAARVQVNGLGLPLALSGGFALTYNLTCQNGGEYAVRCFHKQTDRLEQRYLQISTHLRRVSSPYFLDFEYQPKGVRVNSQEYPIVKMAWAKGETLGEYLERSYADRKAVCRLREVFARLSSDLNQLCIAHGDIQNGNVIVDGGRLRLIDYDGMYVTGMAAGNGPELGHKHFQHPSRTQATFGPEMDRFSFLVLDIGLQALAVDPSLFEKYSNGENLLFTANDLAQPQQSKLFQQLLGNQELKDVAERLAAVCLGDVSAVPTLELFRQGRVQIGAPTVLRVGALDLGRAKYSGAYSVVDATSYSQAEANIGNCVEVVGKITDVKIGTTKGKQRYYIFINFGHWRGKIVKINIWPKGLKTLRNQPDESWTGKWISVTGLMEPPYSNPRFGYTHLSVTVANASQLHVITQQEAEYRLGFAATDTLPAPKTRPNKPPSKPSPLGRTSKTSTSATSAAAQNQQVLERLRQAQKGTGQPAPKASSPKPGNSGCLIVGLIAAVIIGLIVMFLGNSGSTSSTCSGNGVYTPSTPAVPFAESAFCQWQAGDCSRCGCDSRRDESESMVGSQE